MVFKQGWVSDLSVYRLKCPHCTLDLIGLESRSVDSAADTYNSTIYFLVYSSLEPNISGLVMYKHDSKVSKNQIKFCAHGSQLFPFTRNKEYDVF